LAFTGLCKGDCSARHMVCLTERNLVAS
jgi:hypothetical protein